MSKETQTAWAKRTGRAWQKRWLEKNRAAHNEKRRAYYAANKERIRAKQRENDCRHHHRQHNPGAPATLIDVMVVTSALKRKIRERRADD